MLMNEEILKEISSLLSDNKLTWDKCVRIATLYGALQAVLLNNGKIINEIKKTSSNEPSEAVTDEFKDIIPAYIEYVRKKEQYRNGEISESALLHYSEKLTVEINEYITAIKAHATPGERDIFEKII